MLFTTGRFMDIEEISKLCGIASSGMIKDVMQELIQDYQTRNTALEILEDNGKYKLNIKKSYNYLTTKLLDDSELDRPTQETLAIIAYKQPALQSDIIKIRGNGAYDHIKILREQEFVVSERHGRSRMLKLGPKFFDYFDVVEDQMKSKFNEVENKVGKVEEVQATLPQSEKKLETTEQPAENENQLEVAESPSEDTLSEEEAVDESAEEAVLEDESIEVQKEEPAQELPEVKAERKSRNKKRAEEEEEEL